VDIGYLLPACCFPAVLLPRDVAKHEPGTTRNSQATVNDPFNLPHNSSSKVSRQWPWRIVVHILLLLGCWVAVVGCGPAKDPSSVRLPQTQKWFDRARESFDKIDMEDAYEAVMQALRLAPNDPEIQLLAANLALAKLDYDEVLRLTEGTADSKQLALRGRAQWYMGNVEEAGATLDTLLRDPDVHDPWARAVSKLANHGAGRHPFASSGDSVASLDMPAVRGAAMIVPIEIDGEQGLAFLSTGTAEVVLDKAQRKEPSWVSLRFDGRVEFQDVPAVTQDLSGISRMLGAPIKAMLGVNFFRNAHVTFDFQARQFVVRRFSPPRPPRATDIPVFYLRGGAMVTRGALNLDVLDASYLLDSSQMGELVLDADGFRKAGVDPNKLTPVEGQPGVKHGTVPMVRIGSFLVRDVGAALNKDVEALEQALGLNLDGIVGAGLLGSFRVTFGNYGKSCWFEEDFAAEMAPGRSSEPREQDSPTPPSR